MNQNGVKNELFFKKHLTKQIIPPAGAFAPRRHTMFKLSLLSRVDNFN